MPAVPQPSANFRLSLFGPFQVLVGGELMPRPRSRKAHWVLALLALRQGRPVDRGWLAGTLWPEVDDSQALANLRPILTDLRHALAGEGGRIRTVDRQTLAVDLVGADVDVATFDAAIRRGDPASLELAATLYRGPLLEGCTEEWADQERRQREEECFRALMTLGEAALARAAHADAAAWFGRAAAIDAWSDSARRGWMEALSASGDANAAMHVYREFLKTLSADPRAAPDAETTELYNRLRTAARRSAEARAVARSVQPATEPVRGNLPHPLTELIGRESEVAALTSRLSRVRLVTLTGPGGVGKTRLAIAVAWEVADQYQDGTWMVTLDSLRDGALVPQQISTVLGVREQRAASLKEALLAHLRDRRALLVLDNCEHVVSACADTVSALLQGCPGVRILATSREALGLTGEVAWMVPPLSCPTAQHPHTGVETAPAALLEFAAVRLFVERAQAAERGFDVTSSNASALAEICNRLDGLPLAVELAAARVRSMALEQIASRLNDHLGLLVTGGRAAQPRHHTLRATLDWSYELLSEHERTLIRRLSVFAGGWTLDACEHVCCDRTIGSSTLPELLRSLVDKSLVIFDALGPHGPRYRMLEMVRQYTVEALQVSGESPAVHRRHLEFFMALADESEPLLHGAEQERWLRRLEADRGNLRAALAWCEAEADGVEAGLRLTAALTPFWIARGDFHEARGYLARARERDGAEQPTLARAKVLNAAAAVAFSQGEYAASEALNTAALAIQRQRGDRHGVAVSLHGKGSAAVYQGKPAAAREACAESLAIRRALGEPWNIAESLQGLGNVALYEGDYTVASSLFQECLDIRRRVGDRLSIADALNSLALVEHNRGDAGATRALFEECLAIRRELGERSGVAGSLNNLATLLSQQGDLEVARSLFEEALAINREIGNRAWEAINLTNLGDVARDVGDFATAHSFVQQSLAIRREIGDRLGILVTLESLAALIAREATARSGGERERTPDGVHPALRRAARLWGAAESTREQLGAPMPPRMRAAYGQNVALTRAALGEEALRSAWDEGRGMPFEQAVAYAAMQTA